MCATTPYLRLGQSMHNRIPFALDAAAAIVTTAAAADVVLVGMVF